MLRVAIAGNPNSGKTCIFNNLTGGMQHVGNYPGVTVEIVDGITSVNGEKLKIIDLPGTYSLTAYSQEEVVARDFILKEKPDVIINVVDAGNLERNLYLTVQLLELGVPVVIALNMIDVARTKGHVINALKLAELLGVKVVETIGNRRRGMKELKLACCDIVRSSVLPKPLSYTHELQEGLIPLEEVLATCPDLTLDYPAKWLALKLLEDDQNVLDMVVKSEHNAKILEVLKGAKKSIEAHSDEDSVTAVVEARYGIATGAWREVVRMGDERKRLFTDSIDAVVCHRFAGPLVLAGVVYALFAFVFKLADEIEWIPLSLSEGVWVSPMGLFEVFFEYLSLLVERFVSNDLLLSLLNDGIIGGVGGVMGFVPLIFFMFLFISFLEDTGYIARVAFILDRVLRIFGMQGKSILALIVSGGLGGGGCAVPGVMATRTLREEKDRLVTVLVAPIMNCGAKIPVYVMLIGAFFAHSRGAVMFLLWLISWVVALCAALVIRKVLIKGEQTPFVMELPVYHMPTFRGVLTHTWHRTWMYIKKAGTIILAINIILWAMMYFPGSDNQDIFEKQRDKASVSLEKSVAGVQFGILLTGEALAETEAFIADFNDAKAKEDGADEGALNVLRNKDPLRYSFATALVASEGDSSTKCVAFECVAVTNYQAYQKELVQIDGREAKDCLLHSYAGQLGSFMTPLSRLAGFDWKDNIALIGGFAAKEVIVGTLGTAYAMGDVDPDDSKSLSERLAADPKWDPVRAFAFMIFVLIYAPCFVTVAAIKKETGSWKWALFSTTYQTTLGFIVAVLIFQIGSRL